MIALMRRSSTLRTVILVLGALFTVGGIALVAASASALSAAGRAGEYALALGSAVTPDTTQPWIGLLAGVALTLVGLGFLIAVSIGHAARAAVAAR